MALPLRGAAAIRVFACFALGYLLSYALRSVNAVIAPSLMADVGLSNADLGLLSSAFFISVGCMQLPLGVWLDKFGPRRTEAVLLVVAAGGAAMFATSTTLTGLWIARALIGIGVAPCLMASFKAFRQWYAIEQQGQLASWMLVAGTAGAISATLPVTLALPLIGWRGIFWTVSGLLLLVSALIFAFLRDAEREHTAVHGHVAAVASGDGGYRRIFGSAYFRRIGMLGLVNHGIFFALQTLWAGPWMTNVLGKTAAETSRILFAFNLMLMLSYLALGWAAPRLVARGWNVHRIIALGIAGMAAAQGAMLLSTSSGAWAIWLLLAICVPVTTLAQSLVGMAFPAALAGRANSAYNLLLFIGAFVTQWGFGVLVDTFKGRGLIGADAFRATLAIALSLQAGALLYFMLKRAAPEKERVPA